MCIIICSVYIIIIVYMFLELRISLFIFNSEGIVFEKLCYFGLAKYVSTFNPAFLFIHQPLANAVFYTLLCGPSVDRVVNHNNTYYNNNNKNINNDIKDLNGILR